jgi:hypothetical protein
MLEGLSDLFAEVLSSSGASSDLLAVGGDQVFGVSCHPVEANTARHYVLRRGPLSTQNLSLPSPPERVSLEMSWKKPS